MKRTQAVLRAVAALAGAAAALLVVLDGFRKAPRRG